MKTVYETTTFQRTAFRLVHESEGRVITKHDGTLGLADAYYVEERISGQWAFAEVNDLGWAVRYESASEASRAFSRLVNAQRTIQAKDAAAARAANQPLIGAGRYLRIVA